MKHSTSSTLATLATVAATLGLAASSSILLAQEQPAQPTPPPAAETPQSDVADEDVRKFAEIYVGIEQTRSELSQEMSEAEDQEKAKEIQTRMQDEIVAMIEDQGWSLEQYNKVANAINNDPALRQQAIDHIRQMSTG